MFASFAAVGAGGAVGAVLRYLISLRPVRYMFPVVTLCINCTGAFAIGVIAGLSSVFRPGSLLTLFCKTGMCGGFTTFSTFSLETLSLIEDGHYIFSALYIMLSVFGCVAGVWIGKIIGNKCDPIC